MPAARPLRRRHDADAVVAAAPLAVYAVPPTRPCPRHLAAACRRWLGVAPIPDGAEGLTCCCICPYSWLGNRPMSRRPTRSPSPTRPLSATPRACAPPRRGQSAEKATKDLPRLRRTLGLP